MIIKNGMIGFSGGDEFIQKAIKFFIGSKFSHSFVVISFPYGSLSALETTETRVTVTPVDRKLDENNYVEIWDVIAPEGDKNVAADYSFVTYSGKLYGYLSYFWFIYRWFMRLFGIEKKTMWKWAAKNVTCSELTASYLDFLYPELFKGMDINTITPKELYIIVKNNPDKFIRLGWYKE